MTANSLKASVVVPTYNRPEVLAKCLNSLSRQLWENGPLPPECFEVIVSDDSPEQSAGRRLAHLFPTFTFSAGPGRGPAANRNLGASKASGEILIFVDDDCICSDRLIESYIRAASNNSQSNVFEGKTVAIGSPTSHADECPGNDKGGYLWSCNFGIKKDLFETINGFDEAFPYPAMEDVDLRHRLALNGARVEFVADAQVFHPWQTRVGWEFIRRHRISHLIFLQKHPIELQNMNPVRFLTSSSRTLLRATASGVPHYGFKNFSQRLRSLVGDVYLIWMQFLLLGERPRRKLRFIPKRWRLE